MPIRDDPSKVREAIDDDGTFTYRGECEKCHFLTAWFKGRETALSLLERHRKSRAHKSNTAAAHRFEA